MTSKEKILPSRGIFFIPGSPVIISSFVEDTLGKHYSTVIPGQGRVRDEQLSYTILREATLEEYLATVRPEHREFIAHKAEPDAFFYEISID